MQRLFKYLKKYLWLIGILGLAVGVNITLNMFNPYLSQKFIDEVIIKNNKELLYSILFGLGIITIGRTIVCYIIELSADYIGTRVQQDLRIDMFKHIQSLHFGFFDKMNTGELMSRMTQDIGNIWQALGFGLRLLIENIIEFTVATTILFMLNWKLAIFSLITMPVIAWLAIRLEKEIGEAWGKISDQAAEINTSAQENIAGVRLVKAFAREKYEIKKFLELNEANYKLNMERLRVWGKYYPAIEFFGNLSIVIVVSFGGAFVINQQLSIGTLVAFTGYLWSLIWPMRMLGWLMNLVSEANASSEKIFKIMDTPSEITGQPLLNQIDYKGHVHFKNVSFKYEDKYVLKNINFDAKPGSTIAIMGPTGSGKSTLINLISRFYDVSEGEIILDGYNIKEQNLQEMRKQISTIFQDTFLFSETITENIKFGKNDADNDEIKKAGELACASEFVDDLKDGYETIVGERGIGLSGGQKQRLTIARALLKKAKVLILDDATSALDMDTEYNLLKNIKSFEDKVTTFIIAHRISAVKNADEILFLENGEIVERGTHEELVALKGRYYQIYKHQFKDFEDVAVPVKNEVN